MKNVALIMALAIAVSLQSCAKNNEDGKAPDKVISAFNQKFPKAKKVEWEKENENEWEAEFKIDGKEYSANFSSNGEWSETEYEIKESQIPENILAILNSNFTDYEIEGAEIAETIAGKSYEFEIEQGEDEFEVVIDAQGNLTKKKQSEEDEEDDDDEDDQQDED
jgi:hypothetical protein